MLERLKMILMHGDIPSSEKQAVQKNIIEDDRKFVIIWSRAQLVYWGYCLFMSFRDRTLWRLANPVRKGSSGLVFSFEPLFEPLCQMDKCHKK